MGVASRMVLCVALACCADDPPPEAPPPWVPANELEADCARMCEASIAVDCELSPSVERCATRCADSVASTGPCKDVSQDYVRCLGDAGLDDCFSVPASCDEAWASWAMCSPAGEGCGPVVCGDPAEGCTCGAYCEGVLVEEHCEASGDAWDCTCSLEGEVVATCEAMELSCAFFVGCCAPLAAPTR
jgi:hypothetical protein